MSTYNHIEQSEAVAKAKEVLAAAKARIAATAHRTKVTVIVAGMEMTVFADQYKGMSVEEIGAEILRKRAERETKWRPRIGADGKPVAQKAYRQESDEEGNEANEDTVTAIIERELLDKF